MSDRLRGYLWTAARLTHAVYSCAGWEGQCKLGEAMRHAGNGMLPGSMSGSHHQAQAGMTGAKAAIASGHVMRRGVASLSLGASVSLGDRGRLQIALEALEEMARQHLCPDSARDGLYMPLVSSDERAVELLAATDRLRRVTLEGGIERVRWAT